MSYIYHYSKSIHSQLKTLLQQGLDPVRQQELLELSLSRGSKFPYYDSMSFFIDPIPNSVLGSIYPSDHPVWFTGNKLYEYKVSVSSLELKYWTLVESNVDSIINPLWMDWGPYKRLLAKTKSNIKSLIGQSGVDTQSLELCVRKKAGITSKEFLAIHKTDSKQYAAGVTHLMVYPTVPVHVASVREIIIGNTQQVK
jgi:hypothetical protein